MDFRHPTPPRGPRDLSTYLVRTTSDEPGLPKLEGGIAKREGCGVEPCAMPGCDQLAAGVVETLSRDWPICELHIPGAQHRGYYVRHVPLNRRPRQ